MRATQPLAILVLFAAVLAGCAGHADDPSSTGSAPASGSDSAPTGPSTPSSGATAPSPSATSSGSLTTSPLPKPQGPVTLPAFDMPPVAANWNRLAFKAQMPAGSWLFLYAPLPAGHGKPGNDFPRTVSVTGEANVTGPSAYMTFGPFLVNEDQFAGTVPETFFLEGKAGYDASGAGWHYAPFFNDQIVFGQDAYDGIGFLAGSLTPWTVELSFDAPWSGNVTSGFQTVAWGGGFTATQLPPMTSSGPGGAQSSLSWSQSVDAGWSAMRVVSACYNPSPCADAASEDWTMEFPRQALVKTFHHDPAQGYAPTGYFGVLDGGVGDMKVTGAVTGLVGARTVQAFYAPVPHAAWATPLTTSTFTLPS